MTGYGKTGREQVYLGLTWVVTPHADVLPGWSQILRAAGNEVFLLVPRNPHSSRVAGISFPGPDVGSDVQTHDLLALPLRHDRPAVRRTLSFRSAGGDGAETLISPVFHPGPHFILGLQEVGHGVPPVLP